jgi:TolB-like protein
MRAGFKAFSLFFIFVFVLSSFTACGNAMKKPGHTRVENYGRLKKIAVLPFYNISGRREAGKMVANSFVTEIFIVGKYRVEEPGNIMQFMIQENINVVGEMGIDRIKILGRRLGVDAVLVGIVDVFDDGARNTPRISITARLVESESGKIVWSGQAAKNGDDYIIAFGVGKIRSANALAQKLIRKMIKSIKW